MDRAGDDTAQFQDDGLEDVSEEEEEGRQGAQFSSDDGDEDDDGDDDGEEDDDEEDEEEEEDGEEGEEEEEDSEEEEGSEESGDEEEDWETEDDEEDEVLEASDSDSEEAEKCPICLNRFRDQDVGTPEACDHNFCLECIQEWARNVNTCPVDRQVFRLILCKHSGEEKIFKRIPVEDRNTQVEEEDETYCEVCGQCDREDRLLLCDGCDQGYHMDCLTPPLSRVPVEEWFCPECADREGWAEEADDYSEMMQISEENEVNIPRRSRRQIPRTLVSERVRSAIEEIRVRRTRNIRRIVSSSEEEEDEETESPTSSAATPSVSTAKPTPTRKRTTKTKTTRKRTPRKYARKKTTKRKTKRKTTKGKTTKRKTTKKTTRKTTKGKRKGVKRKRKGRKRKVMCLLELMKLRLKDDMDEKERVQEKNLESKLEASKKKTLDKNKMKLEQTISDLEKKARTARPSRPQPVTTPKSRIADSLGLVEPPKGSTIPLQKLKTEKPGETSLSIFGTRDELHHFNDEAASPGPTEVQKPSKYSRLALSSYKPIGRVPTVTTSSKPKVNKDTGNSASALSAPLGLLDSIMQDQNKLHLQSRDILIQKDGSLLEKPKEVYKPKSKPKISFSIGKTSPTKTPGSLFKSTPRVPNPTSIFQKPDHNPKKGSEDSDKPGMTSIHGSMGFQPAVVLNEEYDPAHPTDELEDIGTNVDETKMVQDENYNPFSPTGDEYDPFHPTDDMESDDDMNVSNSDVNKIAKTTKVKQDKSLKDVFDTDFNVGNKISKTNDKADGKFEAVSPAQEDFNENTQKENDKKIVGNDSGTDLEDEVEYTESSDKVVILINQDKKNDKSKHDKKNDENKHPKHSVVPNVKLGAINQTDNAVTEKGSRHQGIQKDNVPKKEDITLETDFELRKSDDLKKEKHLTPPKPGFHGGLPQVLLPHQLKVVAKPSEKDKHKDTQVVSKERGKTEVSMKKSETEKKVNPVQKSLDLIKKSQYRSKPLYGEIDFTEDVSCGESGFPQYFEVNVKRIEDAFKDTKVEEDEKDEIEVIENVPEVKPIDLSDSESKDDQEMIAEAVKEKSVEKTSEVKENEIVESVKKVKSKKQPKVEYIVKVKKDKGKTAEKAKSKDETVDKKAKKRDKKSNEKEEKEKKKSKSSKEKLESKSDKENKSKKKSKRKVTVENDFENEDDDESNYRKELQHVQEINEPKERRKSKDSKKNIKDETSDGKDHHKSEKNKKSSDDSKKSKHEKKKSREESHDNRKSRSDSYERRKSRDDSYDHDRKRYRADSYDRQRSRDDSYDRRRARSNSYDRQRSREDSYERRRRSRDRSFDRRARSRSRERSFERRARSRSREHSYGRRSRERSYDRRSRDRSNERRRSRDRSYDRRRSRADSFERRRAREDSFEHRRIRDDSVERRRTREEVNEHAEKHRKNERRRNSIEETRKHPLLDTYYELTETRDKHKSFGDEIKKSDHSRKQNHKEKASEKKKVKESHKKTEKKTEENKLKLLNIDYESISEDEIASDLDDKHGHVSEIEEGELQEEYWHKESVAENRELDNRDRERDRRNRDDRENRTLFYEETEDGEILYSDKARLLNRNERDERVEPEKEIDTRIVIQVTQDTENRRVWEEDEKKKKKHKKEKEERKKEKNKDSISKKDKKNRRHRSKSSSGSKEKRKRSRSRSHDKSKKKRRDRSGSHSTDKLFRSFSRSHSRDRSLERSSKKKRKNKDRAKHRDKSWDRSSISSDSLLDMAEIYGGNKKSWSRSPLKRCSSRESVEKEDLSPVSQTLMGRILKLESSELSAKDTKSKRKSSANKAEIAEPVTKKAKTAKKTKTAVFLSKAEAKKKKEETKSESNKTKTLVKIPPPPKAVKELNTKESPIVIDEEDKIPEIREEKIPGIQEDKVSDKQEVKILPEVKIAERQEDKVSSSDDEPEETEQFSYTDRDEYLLQNKKQQQRSNLIQISHKHGKPPSPPSPAPPLPGPELREGPTPPLPMIGERFVSSPFPPPPPGPPPGMILTSERPPVHVQVSGPPGQGIFSEGAVIIRGLPPPGDTIPGGPQLIQQRPNMPVGVNVLPPGMAPGMPQPMRAQRPVLVNAFINQPPPGFPRLPNSPGPVRILQNPISSQIPSPGAQIPGHHVVNGPFEGLPHEGPPNVPPPGFPPGEHLVRISTETPPPNLVPLQHDLEGPPLAPPPGSLPLPGPPEPHLVQITSNPPNLPIPLHLPPPISCSEPPPHSVIVSMPPPDPIIVSGPPLETVLISVALPEPAPTSVTPLQDELFSAPSPEFVQEHNVDVNAANAFIRTETPPNSAAHVFVSKSPGIVSTAPSIPGLGDFDTVPVSMNVLGNGAAPDASSNDELPILSQLEEISKLLNVQAKLKIISSQDKRKATKLKDGGKGDGVFKVPLPPGQRGTMGGKGDSVESNEVTDMDMGSPIDEEGNIELPISPQYENLIDKDLEETVAPLKKTETKGFEFPSKTDKQKSVFDDIFSDHNDEKDDEELEDIQDSFENKLDAIGLLKDIEALTKAINHETIKKDTDLGKIKDSDKADKKTKHSKENRHKHRHHHKHKTGEDKQKSKDLRQKALTDAHQEIDSQEMPSSAVDMTNKEKYLKKLHLQERVVEEVKMAIKPHYASKDINKDQYKEILRKAVPKICHSKSGDINPMKIKSLVEAYISKYNKQKTGKDSSTSSDIDIDISPNLKANGERVKLKTNR